MARKKKFKRNLDHYPKDKNFGQGIERTRVIFYETDKASYSKPPPAEKIHAKSGRLGDQVMREKMRMHGGSHAMARGRGLLEHPISRHEILSGVFNTFTRVAGKGMDEHNYQVTLSTKEGVKKSYKLYLLHCWTKDDPKVEIYLSCPGEDDPNFRIVEVWNGKARRSIGYTKRIDCLNAKKYGKLKWIKD